MTADGAGNGAAAEVPWSDPPSDSFARLTERLSEASVRRRWEAYRDVAWDGPEMRVEPDDPRWELPGWDPVGASAWYRDQDPARRSRLGLQRVVTLMKAGIEFEAVLNQGLLRFASKLPNGHPAFRYVYHEISEEAQHSLMFQELVNRSALDPPGSPEPARAQLRRLAELGDADPVLFFVAVLSGEEAFDHIQRRMLASPSAHPLLHRICAIHVAEEARHVSFARGILREAVPRLGERARRHLRYQAPFVVEWTARHMAALPAGPADDEGRADEGPEGREMRRAGMARVAAFCRELGLIDQRLAPVWSKLGLS